MTGLLAYRVNQDARTDWMRRLDAPDAPVPVPAPEVGARLALPGDPVPAPAVELEHKAKALGWHVLVVYSRGAVLGAKGEVLRVADAVSVRMWRFPDERAVALWVDGSANGGWFWTGALTVQIRANGQGVGAVKAYVTGKSDQAKAPSEPAEKRPCPTCEREVSWTQAGRPRVHGPKDARCEGR